MVVVWLLVVIVSSMIGRLLGTLAVVIRADIVSNLDSGGGRIATVIVRKTVN